MRRTEFVVAMFIAFCATMADAQTFKTLLQFSGTGGPASGRYAEGSLMVDGTGTTLYGMTSMGGTSMGFGGYGKGNVFSVGMDGTSYENLLSFTGAAGAARGSYPQGTLTISGPTLFGMSQGAAYGYGNIFSVGIDGTNYMNLVSFTGTGGSANGDDSYGSESLTLAGTTLYGMTVSGGSGGNGNLFSIGTNGTNYENLLSFTGTGGAAIGKWPAGSLTLSNTNLYGMTEDGGVNGLGNVFSVGANGANYQNLLSFTGTSGAEIGADPLGSLTLGGTRLYGMTENGGTFGNGNVFSVGTNGTSYSNLLSFTGTSGMSRGLQPEGDLTLSGTTLYGMTTEGGADGYGNIFSVGIDGSGYQDFYDFTGGTDGGYPGGDLTLSGGTLFGMTAEGGAASSYSGYGTIFELVLPAPTPEPGTLVLTGAIVAALVAFRWRRMRPPRKRRR